MNRIIGLFLLALLVGCHSTNETESAAPFSRSNGDAHRLVVEVDASGGFHVGGYIASEAELPELVKEWHPTSAIVRGMPGAKFGDAVKVQAALKAAGMTDVSIAEETDRGV